MSIPVKDASGTTQTINTLPALGQANAAGSLPAVLASDGNHAKTADLAALQSSLLTALGLLATDQDVMATNAKLEAIRLLLATPALASGAAADASVQAITTKLEAVRLLLATPALATGAATDASVQAVTTKAEAIRALLAGTLAISATALPLPAGAAKDVTLSGAFGTAADAGTPDITATGASFTFVSLFKGMVANLLAIAGKLPASLGAKPSATSLSIAPATDAVFATIPTQASNIATGQVSVAATAGGTQIVPARAGRRQVVIIQEGNGSGGAGTLVRVGASGVTTGTGVPLPGTAYAALTIDGGAAVYGIVASGTQTVSFVEIY